MIELSIIIPAYNEERRIHTVLQSIQNYMESQIIDFEVIVVDDGSQDDTTAVVATFRNTFKHLVIISDQTNRGKGYAVRQGMLRARGAYRMFVDADDATHFSDLERFWPELQAGYDIIIGSRYLPASKIHIKQPWLRRMLGRCANMLIQVMAVWGIRDTQCGFKIFRAQSAENIFSRALINGWGFDFEVLAIGQRLGYTIKEVPVSWHHRDDSRVRPLKSAFKTLAELWRIKRNFWYNRYNIE